MMLSRRFIPVATARCTWAAFSTKAADGAAASGAVSTSRANTVDLLSEAEATAQVQTLVPWQRYNVDKPALNHDNAPTRAVTSALAAQAVGRTAIIYQPSKPAWTSGKQATRSWRIRFDHQPKWSSPLMGYLSSADTMRELKSVLKFDTKEQAVLFARRHGWTFTLDGPKPVDREVKNYSFNFLPEPTEKELKQAGARRARKLYKNSNANKNPWTNLHYTQRGASDKWQKQAGGGSEWTPEVNATTGATKAPKVAAKKN